MSEHGKRWASRLVVTPSSVLPCRPLVPLNFFLKSPPVFLSLPSLTLIPSPPPCPLPVSALTPPLTYSPRLSPTLVFLKAAASCFAVPCNFNLRSPIEGEAARGVLDALPPRRCELEGSAAPRHRDWSHRVHAEQSRGDQPCQ